MGFSGFWALNSEPFRAKVDANSICSESFATRTAIDTLLKIQRQLVKCPSYPEPVQIHKVFVIVFEMPGTINSGFHLLLHCELQSAGKLG